MFQDLQKNVLYFEIDKECHSSGGTQFYCIDKHLFSKIPIQWSETRRWYVNIALESAIMNVHNIQEGKDLNYISVLVYTVDVNLMGKILIQYYQLPQTSMIKHDKQCLLHRWNARLQLYSPRMHGAHTGNFLL
jgi:hypothetical protein